MAVMASPRCASGRPPNTSTQSLGTVRSSDGFVTWETLRCFCLQLRSRWLRSPAPSPSRPPPLPAGSPRRTQGCREPSALLSSVPPVLPRQQPNYKYFNDK